MPEGIRYQPRDIAVLTELGEVGILDLDLIRERHFPDDKSGAATPKKLKQYVRVGLVEQFEKLDLLVYRLSQFGIDEVGRLTGVRPRRVGKHKDGPSKKAIYHRVGVIRMRFAFDEACKASAFNAPRWIMEYDPEAHIRPTKPNDEKWLLCHYCSNANGDRCTFWPDLAGCFQFPSDEPWQLCAFFEYDTGSMVHKDVLDKVTGWKYAIDQDLHRRYWPNLGKHVVRILFVCRGETRLHNLMDDFRGTPAAPFLRMTTEKQLQPVTDLFTRPIWHSADGEIRPILKGEIRRGRTK